MIFWCSAASAAPTAAWLTLVVLKATRLAQLLVLAQVSILRLTALVGVAAAGSLPLRRTSAAAPFSTTDPSGRSENGLVATAVHCPALVAEKFQNVALSWV